jgi:hypothetical protein
MVSKIRQEATEKSPKAGDAKLESNAIRALQCWFKRLRPSHPGQLLFVQRHPNGKKQSWNAIKSFRPDQIEDAARFIESFSDQENLYFKPSLFDPAKIDARRKLTGKRHAAGNQHEMATIIGLHLDADAGKSDSYASQADLREAIKRMHIKPTMVILSGASSHGYHLYYRLAEPIIIDSEKVVSDFNAIAGAFRDALIDRLAAVLTEQGKSDFDREKLVDRTFAAERVLRAIGARRKSGDVVRIASIYDDREYTLEQLKPPGWQAPAKVDRVAGGAPRSADSHIDQYFCAMAEAGEEITIEDLLSEAGYASDDGREWFRSESQTGSRSLLLGETINGLPGVNVFSGGCDPLKCHDDKLSIGRRYSLYQLWVALKFGDTDKKDSWTQAVNFCIQFLRPSPEESFAGVSFDDDQPEVMITKDEAQVTKQVIPLIGQLGFDSPWIDEALNDSVRVFVRCGALVQAIPSDDPDKEGQTIIRPMPFCITRERITQACKLKKRKVSRGEVSIERVEPPRWLIEAIHHRGYYQNQIRPLVAVVHAPAIRVDGSIFQTPGYDRKTGLLYVPNATYPEIPETPSRADAKAAMDHLCEVVVDFPFLDDADKAAWVCLVLSMIGRACVNGCVPLFAITANIRGAGKSLMVDTASMIAYGRSAARKPFTRDEAELRKVITSIAIEAAPSVLFDNVDVQLGGSTLDLALTSTSYSDRVLGTNTNTDLPLYSVWTATGNNMTFGSDVGRRVLCVRLLSDIESPETRSGFVHSDLLTWVKENRPSLAAAALTVLRAYFVAGKPKQRNGEWGSFENWSRIIRGAVVWAGAADPLITRETATANDDSRNLLAMLINGLEEADPDRKGLTTKEIENASRECPAWENGLSYPTLAEAVSIVCPERFNGQRFGKRMRSYVNRVWGGKKITAETATGGVSRWRVQSAISGSVGSGGSATGLSTRTVKAGRDSFTT